MKVFDYTLQDFINEKYDMVSLEDEIRQANIGAALLELNGTDTTLQIEFKIDLTSQDQVGLAEVIANHTGVKTRLPSVVDFLSKDSAGRPLISTEKPYGNFDTLVTPNFCAEAGPYELKPEEGKSISIVKAECQFEHDLAFNGAVFILDYYVWFEHPQAGWIEVVGQQKTFTSIRSLFELGNEHYHAPAIGTEMPHGLTTLSFSYPQRLKLTSQKENYALSKLVCRLENDHLPQGSYVTIGFVTEEEDL